MVNVHYLADALEAHLATPRYGLEVTISDERDLLLETGGGLVRAQAMIDSDPFLAINSDNLWIDGPADTLEAAGVALGREQDGRAVAPGPAGARDEPYGPGRFSHGPGRPFAPPWPLARRAVRLHRRADRLEGVAQGLRPKGAFSTNVLWDRAIAAGRCYGAVHQGLWFDVGNPAAIRATEQVLANV